jgi:hypothetical protein
MTAEQLWALERQVILVSSESYFSRKLDFPASYVFPAHFTLGTYISAKNNIFCRRDLHLPVSARLTRLMRLAMIFSRRAILVTHLILVKNCERRLTVNPEQECCSYCLSPGHLGKIVFD